MTTTSSSPWSTTWGASTPNAAVVPSTFSSTAAAPSPPSFSSSLFKDAGARDAWAESAQGPRRAAPMPTNAKVLSMRKTAGRPAVTLTRKTPTLLQTPPPHQVQVRSVASQALTAPRSPVSPGASPKRSTKGRSGGRSRRGTPIESSLQRQDLFKTEVCRSFQETGACRYGSKCQFAHGESELRPVLRHPKYKTELCRTFETKGTCPYGPRCRFLHYRANSAPVSPAPAIPIDAPTSKKGSRLPFFQMLHRSRSSDGSGSDGKK